MSRAQLAQKSVQRLVATGALRLTSVPQNVVEQLTQFINAELSKGVSLARAEVKVLELAKQIFKASKTSKGEKSRGEDDENAVDEEVGAEIFQNYTCKSLEGVRFASGCIATAHPGEIAESGLLASVPLPTLSYCTAALDGCASRSVLSDLQIEGCLHACQRHTALNFGVRAGFFLGDGAGVGKGRQIAAMILDNVARGRQKHIWFSISSDLRLDAERDLRDVGCHVDVIDGCQSLDSAAKLAFGSKQSKRGVLFSTYSTLISALSYKGSNRKARLDQLIEWCGGTTFEGLLVFDESHKSKNFDVKKAENSTKMSQAVIAIQEQLPLARVVYASATGVTEITNLAYASRLGLFGPGTSFENFLVFSETMEKRGVGALEMLALELKASGAYVSRGLSWSRCEFEHVICCLPDDDVAIYDALTQWWRALRHALDYALGVIEHVGVRGQRGLTWQRFWGTQLRFFKEVQTALKVPFVIDVATRALGEGSVVVIGLQSTGEAGLDAAMARARLRPGDTVPGGLVAGAKVAARRFVEEFFPVSVPDDANDGQSNDSTSALLDDDMAARLLQIENQAPPTADQVLRFKEFTNQSNSIVRGKREALQTLLAEPIPELVRLKEEVLQQLDALTVPASPLDTLIDSLGGTSAVAEMTGRASRIARTDSRIGPLRYEQRLDNSKAGSSSESLNVRERRAFMDGKKSIAIISDAASTGVSLHAANGTPAAHKRRVHITLELAWSADKTIQQLGRSHRANQASAPKYKLVTTDLAGENRFAAAVAKRLSSLGALTKGDRRAASGQDMADFDVDNKHGRTALGKMAAACKNRFENAMAPSVSLSANSNESLRKALAFARAAAVAQPSSAERALSECFDGAQHKSFQNMFERAALVLASPAKDGEPYFDVVSSDDVVLAVLARRAYAQLEIDPKKENDVRTFLNRLQALDVVAQNLLFEYFCACLRSELAEAKRNGTLDAGVADVRAASAIVDRADVVGTDPLSGATTTLSEILLDRGVSFDGAIVKHDDAIRSDFENENDDQLAHLLFTRLAQPTADNHDTQEKPGIRASVESYQSDSPDKPLLNPMRRRWETGFYVSQRPLPSTQKHGVLLAVRKKGSANFVVTRPNTGTSPYEMALIDLQQKYRPMSIETSEGRERLSAKWDNDYTEAEHEGKGARVYKVGLVSGAVLPFWKALEKTVIENKAEMTRAEQALKVCRICLDDGQKLVGIRFPYAVLSALRANMHAEKVAKGVALSTMKIENPTPVDTKALVAASTKPKTLYNYFVAASSSKEAIKSSPTILKRTTEAPSTKSIKRSRNLSSKPPLKGKISTFFHSTNSAGKQGLTRRDRLPHLAANAECPICRTIVDVDAMNEHLDSSCLGSN